MNNNISESDIAEMESFSNSLFEKAFDKKYRSSKFCHEMDKATYRAWSRRQVENDCLALCTDDYIDSCRSAESKLLPCLSPEVSAWVMRDFVHERSVVTVRQSDYISDLTAMTAQRFDILFEFDAILEAQIRSLIGR